MYTSMIQGGQPLGMRTTKAAPVSAFLNAAALKLTPKPAVNLGTDQTRQFSGESKEDVAQKICIYIMEGDLTTATTSS
jgi:hypothetical protein